MKHGQWGRERGTRMTTFKMWIWRRTEKIKLVDRVRNEEVLNRVKENRALFVITLKRKENWT